VAAAWAGAPTHSPPALVPRGAPAASQGRAVRCPRGERVGCVVFDPPPPPTGGPQPRCIRGVAAPRGPQRWPPAGRRCGSMWHRAYRGGERCGGHRPCRGRWHHRVPGGHYRACPRCRHTRETRGPEWHVIHNQHHPLPAGFGWPRRPANRDHHTNPTASMGMMVHQRRRPHARYLGLRQHPTVGHEYLLHGPVGRGGLDGLDLVQNFQAFRDAPKDHVLAVQPRGLRVATCEQGRTTTETWRRTTTATAQAAS